MKTYTSLFSKSKEQSAADIFAHFPWDGRNGENWETPFKNLAKGLANNDEWSFKRPEYKKFYKQEYPILTNYLNYTFLRLQDLDRISYSEDGSKSCFNTGLQTKEEKDIFALFYRNNRADELNQPDWTFYSFVDSYSQRLEPYRPLPDIAEYVQDPADLVFDTRLKLEVNFDHIIEKNSDRLPSMLQENKRLALTAIKGAVESLASRVRRNYKIAIPHWYDNKLQLLLPLNLTSDTVADVALVVDKDKAMNMYRARTILRMDMAYIDARLINKPDRDWLNP